MVTKLTADQQRRVGDIQQFQKVVEHVAKLVAELNSNRAAKATFIDNICESIARQLSQMRQRALTSGVGTIADVAGAMSVMAGRGGGIDMKIRGLSDGVNSLRMQLDQALKQAMTPEPKQPPGQPH
ncbi:MAG: hypothetical protein AUH78_08845 [Gemmatimonadetes bacterium 13_1_40CM_4_69_8]|nr:MAG: hypothetical protein AUH45_04990 [Gemmatimonadetes bacterium 13_1_40CM_69_22]OLC75432.1 MAG: hypothetical protein AUH78_08845 [Gemmatimonadetes bacterium 13_1_40CM_4_69_8]